MSVGLGGEKNQARTVGIGDGGPAAAAWEELGVDEPYA